MITVILGTCESGMFAKHSRNACENPKQFAHMFPSESRTSGIYARNGIYHFGTITCDPSILVGLRLENTAVQTATISVDSWSLECETNPDFWTKIHTKQK